MSKRTDPKYTAQEFADLLCEQVVKQRRVDKINAISGAIHGGLSAARPYSHGELLYALVHVAIACAEIVAPDDGEQRESAADLVAGIALAIRDGIGPVVKRGRTN